MAAALPAAISKPPDWSAERLTGRAAHLGARRLRSHDHADESFRSDFIIDVIFGSHLVRNPDPAMRERYVASLTAIAADDDQPFELDYWRLTKQARRA